METALYTKEITIEHGRDKGLTFKITEMSAWDAEPLLLDVADILAKAVGKTANIEVGEADINKMGLALLSGIDLPALKPIFERLLKQVVWLDNGVPRQLGNAPIKDLTTILLLKAEAVKVHTHFLELMGEESPFRQLWNLMQEKMRLNSHPTPMYPQGAEL